MIFKSDLVEAINGLSHDLVALSIRVSDLEKKVNEKNTVQVKRSTGNRKASVWTEESKKKLKFSNPLTLKNNHEISQANSLRNSNERVRLKGRCFP